MWTTWLSAGVSRSDLCSFSVLLSTLAIYVRYAALCTLQAPNDSHSFPRCSVYENLTVLSFQTYLSTSNHLKMDNELHDLNVIHEAEDIGEAHDSTTLLDPSGENRPVPGIIASPLKLTTRQVFHPDEVLTITL